MVISESNEQNPTASQPSHGDHDSLMEPSNHQIGNNNAKTDSESSQSTSSAPPGSSSSPSEVNATGSSVPVPEMPEVEVPAGVPNEDDEDDDDENESDPTTTTTTEEPSTIHDYDGYESDEYADNEDERKQEDEDEDNDEIEIQENENENENEDNNNNNNNNNNEIKNQRTQFAKDTSSPSGVSPLLKSSLKLSLPNDENVQTSDSDSDVNQSPIESDSRKDLKLETLQDQEEKEKDRLFPSPKKSVSFKTVRRPYAYHFITDKKEMEDLEPFANEAVKFFTEDWKYIERKDTGFQAMLSSNMLEMEPLSPATNSQIDFPPTERSIRSHSDSDSQTQSYGTPTGMTPPINSALQSNGAYGGSEYELNVISDDDDDNDDTIASSYSAYRGNADNTSTLGTTPDNTATDGSDASFMVRRSSDATAEDWDEFSFSSSRRGSVIEDEELDFMEPDSHILASCNHRFPWKKIENFEFSKCGRKMVDISEVTEDPTKFVVAPVRFNLSSFEPLFLSLSLYDARLRKKVSENYYVQVLDDEMFEWFEDPLRQCLSKHENRHSPLFTVTRPNPDMFLVVCVYKVLQGKQDQIVKHYTTNKHDNATLKKGAKEAASYLGFYQQPLAFGVKKIFEQDHRGDTVVKSQPQSMSSFYRLSGSQKSPFYIEEFIASEKTRKMTSMPGSFVFDVKEASINNKAELFEDLVGGAALGVSHINEYEFQDTIHQRFQPIMELSSASPTLPYLHFCNSLLVYPLTLRVPKLKSGSHVAVKALFRTDDVTGTDNDWSGQEQFISGLDNSQRSKYRVSSVTFKCHYPQFHEEFRVDCPLPPEKKHHLFFVFYYVHPNGNKSDPLLPEDSMGSAPRSIIGYSFLRLYGDNIVPDGSHSLPIYSGLPKNYLEDVNASDLSSKQLQDKAIFNLRSRFVSTVYPHEQRFTRFLRDVGPLLDIIEAPRKRNARFLETAIEASCASMIELTYAQSRSLLPYMPNLLNMILYILTRVPELLLDSEEEMPRTGSFVLDSYSNSQGNDSILSSLGGSSPSATPRSRGKSKKASLQKLVDKLRMYGFKTLIGLLKSAGNVHRKTGRDNPLLSFYVQYMFNNVKGAKFPLYRVIAENWNQMMKKGNNSEDLSPIITPSLMNTPSTPRRKTLGRRVRRNQTNAATQQQPIEGVGVRDSVSFSWFLFDLMSRSILLYTNDKSSSDNNNNNNNNNNNTKEKPNSSSQSSSHSSSASSTPQSVSPPINSLENNGDDQRSNLTSLANSNTWNSLRTKYDEDFLEELEQLMQNLAQEISSQVKHGSRKSREFAKEINLQAALFITDLFSVFGKKDIVNIVDTYLTALVSLHIPLDFRANFMDIIVDNPWFIPFNNPKPKSPEMNRTQSFIGISRREDDSFGEIFVDVVTACIQDSSVHLFNKGVRMLSYHLTKHDADQRFQTKEQRQAIAALYLPLVEKVCDNKTLLNILRKDSTDEDSTGSKRASKEMNESRGYVMLCVLWVLRNLNPEQTKSWWNGSTRKSKVATFDFLYSMLSMYTASLRSSAPSSPSQHDKSKQTAETVSLSICEVMRYLISFSSNAELEGVADQDVFSAEEEELEYVDPELAGMEPENAQLDEEQNEGLLLQSCKLFSRMLGRLSDSILFGRIIPHYIHPFIQEHLSSLTEDSNDIRWRILAGSLLSKVDFKRGKEHSAYNAFSELLSPYSTEIRERARIKFDPNEEDNIIFEENDSDKIKAATLNRLIQSLTDEKMDIRFREVFFFTYRSFTTPSALLDLLQSRFQQCNDNKTVPLRIAALIKFWIDTHAFDFDNMIITRVISFIEEEVEHSVAQQAVKNIKRTLVRMLLEQKKSHGGYMFREDPPQPEVPRNVDRRAHPNPEHPFDLLEWSSVEIARQITLIEYNIFKQIEPRECFDKAWAKENKAELAPNIVSMTERFNKISNWVCTEVLRATELRKRKNVVSKFIEIASQLRAINNFNGINEIIAGLSNAAVYRLHKTWDQLNNNQRRTYDELRALMAQDKSYAAMRAELSNCEPPCVPYIGVWLTDLTFIEDGNKNNHKDLINFHKRELVANILSNMKTYQQSPYNFEEVTFLRHALSKTIFEDLWNDDKLYETSLKVEPRNK